MNQDLAHMVFDDKEMEKINIEIADNKEEYKYSIHSERKSTVQAHQLLDQ